MERYLLTKNNEIARFLLGIYDPDQVMYNISIYINMQGRRTSQCHRAMALVVFCLAAKVCYASKLSNKL